jgi:hypothetical protein
VNDIIENNYQLQQKNAQKTFLQLSCNICVVPFQTAQTANRHQLLWAGQSLVGIGGLRLGTSTTRA